MENTASGAGPLKAGKNGWTSRRSSSLLAWHGFPSGNFDGKSRAAPIVRCGISSAGRAWRPTASRGRPSSPRCTPRPHASRIALAWPVLGPIGSPFGPRGFRFHSGIDIVAPGGTPVRAAAEGKVAYAGWAPGGWGKLVIVDHASGTRSMYAHLSTVGVKVGEAVVGGSRVGRVGATGDATGPHLHFEVRIRGASVDPLPALG